MAVDQIDQVDRAITPRRHPSPGDQVGRGIGGITHWVSAMFRRLLVLALGLIKTTIAAIPSVLRSVVRAARGLLSRVGDLVLRIARGAVGIFRLPAGKVTGHEEQ